MTLDDFKLKLDEFNIDQSSFDDALLSEWIEELNANKTSYNNNELKVKILELEIQRDNEQDWRKKCQIQARIISSKLDY